MTSYGIDLLSCSDVVAGDRKKIIHNVDLSLVAESGGVDHSTLSKLLEGQNDVNIFLVYDFTL